MVRLLAALLIAGLLAALPAVASQPEVGSLTAYPEGRRYQPPVTTLAGDPPVIISFDLLEPENRQLRYSITHCDAGWQPSALSPIEYASGFNESRIDDYAYSRATLIPYVNYRLTFPAADLSPLISGNYLINIFDEDTPDRPIIQVPVMVAEQRGRIEAEVTGRTDFDYNNAHQQLSVTLDCDGLDIADPWNDIRLVITPDGRRDAAATLSRPMRVNGSLITYAHDPALTFSAGKEYRRFETVATSRYLPMGVDQVTFADPWYHFRLATDTPRAGHDYVYDRTQHGQFTIGADNISDPDTEAEYVKVHFYLDLPEQPQADIIIEGDLTGRNVTAQSPGLMTFNRLTGLYEAVLTLKQGSYNYQYLVLPHGSRTTLTGPIEGDDYQTDNQYDIAVYHRPPGSRYDRLVTHTTIYSRQ